MFKKIFIITFFSLFIVSSFLAAVEYEVQDIGTLQTRSSQAIALNNQGQILGWYNIDGSNAGKHFFVRNRDGSFYELPNKENGVGSEINWRYLTDDGKAYGTFDGNANFAVLYMWDQKNGVIKLGNLPGKEISAINNAGQVLIKSLVENENGKSIRRPIIWYNGKITKLNGVAGNIGIESEESYGLDMNNNGDVVGQSLVSLNNKNEIYKQVHAVKWVNGEAVNLHQKIPKSNRSLAIAINDHGDILIDINSTYDHEKIKILKNDAKLINISYAPTYVAKINNKCDVYGSIMVANEKSNIIFYNDWMTKILQNDLQSNWLKVNKVVSVNDNGEIIAQGETIYGEQHIMLLTPIKIE